MRGHRVHRSAHRIEMAQIYEINEYLCGRSRTKRRFRPVEVTASQLGLEEADALVEQPDPPAIPRADGTGATAAGSTNRAVHALPATARLRRVVTLTRMPLISVYGLFQPGRSSQPLLRVPLATEHLTKISAQFFLHHHWRDSDTT
jgi:hypothetical protein